MPACPTWAFSRSVKNGRIHNGKQRFKCHDFGRQFALASSEKGDPSSNPAID
ncbi:MULTISPECIES: IS1/IS1595 family N-terminal zinc-binding domain-containing protein [unclassified Microcoleus]|uniref:IS1/IS1595 family N-terminal zinc-binding domain-containing protein n=1 Tax=unclassified Microcoleus TaxID=2642155 RepID=UPI00403EFC2A